MDAKTGAPALVRGIRILQLLTQEGPMLLEQISANLDIPKASAFRLLSTLEQIRMIRRDPDKSYSALYRLRPLVDSRTSFYEALDGRMLHLVGETNCTIEWYEETQDGMQLVLQKHPDCELCVQARPGFLRDWRTEFEAVTRIAHAFAARAPKLASSKCYKTNGVMVELRKTEIQSMIRSVKARQSAIDEAFNSNGVRRVAVPAFDDSGDFLGVLAVAQTFRFSDLLDTQCLLQLLQKN